MKMSKPKSKSQVFAARLFSTLLLALVVGGTFVSMNPWAFMGLIVVLSIAATRELFAMNKLGELPCQHAWGLFCSIGYTLAVGYLLAARGEDGLQMIEALDVAAIGAVVLGSFILQLRHPIDGQKSLLAVACTVLSFLYVPFLFSFMGRVLFMGGGESLSAGAWLLLWLVCVTKFTDIGAYCTGSLIGRHKMIPHISPGKTWQGFFGALVWSAAVGSALYLWQGEALSVLGGWPAMLLLCVVLSLLTVVGDLAESVIKRSLAVKDSGNTLPGIGGALDLIDSLCFTAPALYFYLRWLA